MFPQGQIMGQAVHSTRIFITQDQGSLLSSNVPFQARHRPANGSPARERRCQKPHSELQTTPPITALEPGNVPRSTIKTSRPRLAIVTAEAEPAGRAPTTIASELAELNFHHFHGRLTVMMSRPKTYGSWKIEGLLEQASCIDGGPNCANHEGRLLRWLRWAPRCAIMTVGPGFAGLEVNGTGFAGRNGIMEQE